MAGKHKEHLCSVEASRGRKWRQGIFDFGGEAHLNGFWLGGISLG